jgi:tetratricopeptide (TPR) repeat protein
LPGPADKALDLRDKALAALDAGDETQARELAARALTALAEGGLRHGPDEAAILVALAEIEEAADRLDDARAAATAAVTILDESVRGDVPATDWDDDTAALWCQAQERLAGLERLAGDYATAEARLRGVLDRATSALGEASLPVLSAACALGVVCKACGDFDAAEAAYARAAAVLDELDDPDPLLRAVLLHNQGGLAHARGDAAAGIPLAEEGAALRERVLGPLHPDVARDLNALGALYHLAGRLDDAARAYDRALAVFEESYGPCHFEVGMTCANLAVLLGDRGDFAQAESSGHRALGIFIAVLGPLDTEVGLTLLNLAAAVAGQDRTAEAAELAARAMEILRTRLPSGHPYLVAATEALDVYCHAA